MIKTFLDGTLLPINPLEDVTIQCRSSNKQMEIVSIGDITLLGSRGLYSLTIKSIFTDNIYHWSTLSNPKPAKTYVEQITAALEKKEPVRLIIIGDGLDINLRCSIEEFTTSQAAGETNEYYYTLSLKEYRQPVATRLDVVPDELKRPKATASQQREGTKPTGKTYTVKAGDCLWSIAQAQMGNGNDYPKLYNANKALLDARNNKYGQPKYTIYPGQVLTIPS